MVNLVKKKNLAIILARKGSKRIPKKNIVEFHKKPLIAWTIKAAKESNLFDNIIVSTDSDEIKRISIDLGAEVPFLRKKHFDDFSPSSLATLDTLNLCEKELGFDYKNVFQLMPNCPLRTSKDIISSYNFFSKKEAVSQISCADFGWQNPWWAIKLNEENSGTPVFPKMFSQRSQDQEKLYGLSGAI